jgi:nitrous oxidase accessory protein NosD
VRAASHPAEAAAVEVSGNEVSETDGDGIRLRVLVDEATIRGNVSHHNVGHGIFGTETTDSQLSGNELHDNVNPDGVSTTGLLLDAGSHRNLVERNLAHANQDSGFQVTGGTLNGAVVRNQDNVLVRNISFENGDHGFDNRESDGTRLISNTRRGRMTAFDGVM